MPLPHKQWHPLFVTSLKEALSDALPGQVEIIPELALSSKPLDIDVLVVKKSQMAQLRHPMTGIFKTYNLFEFKSPDDNLDLNDYDKGIAIARLYKVIKHPKMHTLNDITLTFVSRKHPASMLELLKTRELAVHKGNPAPGIYRVLGESIPVQIMVLKELQDPETAYMFAVFLTGREKIRLDATMTLIKKHLADPTSPYRRDLLEFKIKNQLISTEEMEVLLKMLNQANEQEKVKIKELLQSHPFSQEVKKEGKLEEKRKIAIKLLHLEMDVDTIAKVTGLTQTQIEELKKQMLDGKP